MSEVLDERESEIAAVRAAVRGQIRAGKYDRVEGMLARLRAAERAWVDALGCAAPTPALSTAREQVHHALQVLGAPASPRLIARVHSAFCGEAAPAPGTASLLRDERRSFERAATTRPYYLCAALHSETLAAVRALVAVSSWPAHQRIIGPQSPEADRLTHIVRIAEQITRLRALGGEPPAALALLAQLAGTVPGALVPGAGPEVERVVCAAQARRALIGPADAAARRAGAERLEALGAGVASLFGVEGHVR